MQNKSIKDDNIIKLCKIMQQKLCKLYAKLCKLYAKIMQKYIEKFNKF